MDDGRGRDCPVGSRARAVAGNEKLTCSPGSTATTLSLAPCNSATALTKLKPRPLPGVVRLRSPDKALRKVRQVARCHAGPVVFDRQVHAFPDRLEPRTRGSEPAVRTFPLVAVAACRLGAARR